MTGPLTDFCALSLRAMDVKTAMIDGVLLNTDPEPLAVQSGLEND